MNARIKSVIQVGLVLILLISAAMLMGGCKRAIHDGLDTLVNGGVDSQEVTDYIKSHPTVQRINDGYCVVTYGGPNPHGGSNFRVTNNSDEKRLVTISFLVKNGKYAYGDEYFGTSKDGHSESTWCSCVVEPGETRDTYGSWSDNYVNGARVDYGNHSVAITKMESETTDRDY